MYRWIWTLADVLRLLVLPGIGAWRIVVDRPLTPLTAGVYLVMMGLAPASLLDLKKTKSDDTERRP